MCCLCFHQQAQASLPTVQKTRVCGFCVTFSLCGSFCYCYFVAKILDFSHSRVTESCRLGGVIDVPSAVEKQIVVEENQIFLCKQVDIV